MALSFLRLLAIASILAGAVANPMATGDDPTPALQARANTQLNPTTAAVVPLEMALTNGQRLARGLTPNKPHFRRQADRTGRPRTRPSAVAVASAPGQAHCGPRSGVVHVTGTGLDGFLAASANRFGEYGYTTTRADALTVSINDCNGSPFDLVSTNGFRAYPYIGGVQGFASNGPDLRPGSANYAYIAGTTETAPHATPQQVGNSFSAATGNAEAAESAIWSFHDSTSSTLRAQWINTDGSTPATVIAYIPSEGVFVFVGDLQAFEGQFGNVEQATFAFDS
ncbi:hypothetical protein PHLGIDRAFT_37937 [Phlebiopsis gigantea 11061_1 CR5-6]|uniref:Uncharacterized protein n=1 Tax=Phlebiopsis gigantea (strain 11061_1 CR5-6) TaxID=745531 RepID=A0A0C3S0A9_PHLG1|nr:hypothetical protein PHLGIDRAFT_37937 [Phlebiopsis gigantea 11061_1 CR5-6]